MQDTQNNPDLTTFASNSAPPYPLLPSHKMVSMVHFEHLNLVDLAQYKFSVLLLLLLLAKKKTMKMQLQ